tara:strand:+ start:1485 stop:2027 length:543 start_codon:yes stop_codon:yes gene_type:complete
MTGYYGVTTEAQARKRLRPLYKYNIVEKADAYGFNASKIQDYITDYLAKHGMKLLTEHHDKEGDIDWTVENLCWLKFWQKLLLSICKDYDVPPEDIREVSKGMSLIAWYMADDWENEWSESIEKKNKDLLSMNYHALVQYLAMSVSFNIMGTNRKNKREEAQLVKEVNRLKVPVPNALDV